MKKLIVAFTVFAVAITGKAFAQPNVHDITITKAADPKTAGKVSVHDINITKATQSGSGVAERQVVFAGSTMKEGVNSLTKAGTGTLQFTKRGNTIIDVIFNDNAGNTIKLLPEPGTTNILTAGTWEIRANTKTKLFRFFGDAN